MNKSLALILGAVALFGLLHTVLASKPCKKMVINLLGASGQRFYRLIYNLISVISLAPVLWLVLTLPDTPFYVIPKPWILLSVFIQFSACIGLAISVIQTGAIRFLGLDAFLPAQPEPQPIQLITSGVYRRVRHPIYTFSLIFLWLLPVMSANILAFNLAATLYFFIGALFEERKLLADFGAEYSAYQKSTPMIIPWPKKNM
jgi:protein-S-isoprenylcysteine O-methyltransferase Ste14